MSREENVNDEKGRWTSKAKMEVVLRLLRGEPIDALSRELKVTAARLTQWRNDFLEGGQANLKRRRGDARDEEIRRLRRKVGELTMDKELLDERLRRVEKVCPPALWRSRK